MTINGAWSNVVRPPQGAEKGAGVFFRQPKVTATKSGEHREYK